MKRRTKRDRDIYDKILLGAVLMLAAEVLGPVPLLGPIIRLAGLIL